MVKVYGTVRFRADWCANIHENELLGETKLQNRRCERCLLQIVRRKMAIYFFVLAQVSQVRFFSISLSSKNLGNVLDRVWIDHIVRASRVKYHFIKFESYHYNWRKRGMGRIRERKKEKGKGREREKE